MLSLLGHHDGWLLVTSHRQVAPLKTRTKNVSALSRVKGYSTVPTDLWTDWKFTQKLNLKICSIHPDLSTMAGQWIYELFLRATLPFFHWYQCIIYNATVIATCKVMKKTHSFRYFVSQHIFAWGWDQKFIIFDLQWLEEGSDFLHTVAIQARQKFQSNLRR